MSVCCYSTLEHRASRKQHQQTVLLAISLTCLQVFPIISASSSIVHLQLPGSRGLLHVSYTTAIIIFCAMRVALSNTVHKIWNCAASPAASIEGLKELTCLSCHIFIDLEVFGNSVKVFLLECAPSCCVAFI